MIISGDKSHKKGKTETEVHLGTKIKATLSLCGLI